MASDGPVVAYCRVSTLEQKRRGYGINIQIRNVEAFAERQALLVARFYQDEAESGIKEDRRQLWRLLRDCRAGRVGSVILPSLDRLSRNVRVAENLFHEFEQLGVDVLIAEMPTYTAGTARTYSAGRSARRSRRKTARRSSSGSGKAGRSGCGAASSRVPYGFRRVGRRLEVDDAEAETSSGESSPSSIVARALRRSREF